jgi:hypothetical protein
MLSCPHYDRIDGLAVVKSSLPSAGLARRVRWLWMPMDNPDPAATFSRWVDGCGEITASGQFLPVLGCAPSEFDDWGFGAWPPQLSTVLNFQPSAAVGDCAWSEIVSGVSTDVISLAEVELTSCISQRILFWS